MNATAIEPSPTAEATRLMLPARTSPTAKIPGRLVSSRKGARVSGHLAASSSSRDKTGPDLSREELDAARWPLTRAPFLLETSRPGIFAVGDVRAGNIKRVASAVGEGSIAVAFIHQVLRKG